VLRKHPPKTTAKPLCHEMQAQKVEYMFKHPTLKKLEFLCRRHWIVAVCIATVTAIMWYGAPAWAAPVARPLYQTVPRPTPTSESGPVATATPQPADDDDGSSGGGGSSDPGAAPVDPNAPNITFPQNPGSTGTGNTGTQLTALVTVNGLNLRDGPGTSFNTLGNIPTNTEVTVLSRNEDGTWWYICCLPGTQTNGWVSAQLLAPNFDAAQANTLLPLFGTAPSAPAAATPQPANQTQPQAALPLAVDFFIEPYFVWQGITATLTITVNNPNTVDAENVLLSDELPAGLTLVTAEADAAGTVEITETPTGRPLLLFRWNTIPADTGATATIVALVNTDLANGAVIDNLVATRARNVTYSTSAITIGLPPVVPPDFQ
jgi:uncharacterized repeat protein (TIGR01451 family)